MTETSPTSQREPVTDIATGCRKTTTSGGIKDLILADGLRPGDLLPTEGELCDRLGVSRSNLREAIRKLSISSTSAMGTGPMWVKCPWTHSSKR